MTLIKCILTLVFVALGVCAIAQVRSTRRKTYIIDGFFFHRLPIDENQIINKVTVSAPSGAQAVAVFTAEPLSDFQIQAALPSALIPESELLLRSYYKLKQEFSQQL